MQLNLALWPARIVGLISMLLGLVKSEFNGKLVVIFTKGKIQTVWQETNCSADLDELGESWQRLQALPLSEGGDRQGS